MKKLLKGLILIIIFGTLALVSSYFIFTSAPSKDAKEVVIFHVDEGSTYSSISSSLLKSGLIKNELAYKVFIKIKKPKQLEYGDYSLSPAYDLNKLIEVFEKGSENLSKVKTVTFVEGRNMRYVIDKITGEFDITEKEIIDKLSDSDYLDTLISKYWFLTNDIKNKDIYYSLEGYLFPDTYSFYENAALEDIFKVMLDNMENKLNEYKTYIDSSDYSIHEIITLASIIELEAGKTDDRKGVAGVFYNRLKDNWSLGSDVTTYYAERLDNWSTDLKMSQLNKCNNYNTRSSCMNGKLPISPICNASINSLVAAIEPTEHDYYYFVADKNGKTYFNKTDSAHNKKVNELKKAGLWIEYE